MSHIGRAHTVSIEEDEDGFTITLEGVDELDGICRVNIQDVAEQLYDQCRSRIGPWLRERDEARTSTPTLEARAIEESYALDDAYALTDPKHPDYHSAHADLWDNREGK